MSTIFETVEYEKEVKQVKNKFTSIPFLHDDDRLEL